MSSIITTSNALISKITNNIDSGAVFLAHCEGTLLKAMHTDSVLQALACARLVLALESSFNEDSSTSEFFLQLNMIFIMLTNCLKELGTDSIYFHEITDLLLAIHDCE